MNKLKALMLAALVSTGASAALRTTAQDGQWGSASTWQGGNIPGSGDTINFFHIVYATDTRVFGTSPAEGTVVGNFNSTGTLVILAGSSVTVNGDLTYTAGTSNTTDAVRVTAGGTLNLAHYSFYPDNNFGWRKFTAIGTSTAPAQVVGNVASNASLKTGGFAYVGGYTFNYAVLRNLSFSMYYRDDNGTADPTQWIVTNSTFTGCGQITNSGGLHPDAVFRHEHNTHINTTSSNVFDFRIGYAKSSSGRRIISSTTFDSSIGDNLGLKDFTMNGNFLTDRFNALYSSATWSKNFFRTTADNISIGNVTTSYFLLDVDMGNEHLINVVTPTDYYDGNIFGNSGRNTGECGEWIIGGAETIPSTFTLTRNIYPPNSDGYQSGEMTSMIATAGDSNSWLNYYYDFRHNTYFGGCIFSGDPFGAVDVSETANIAPGRLAVFKSNLMFNPQLPGKSKSFVKVLDVGNLQSDQTAGYGVGPTSNICTAATCNYNGSYGMLQSSITNTNTSKYLNQGRGYVANYTATPGANDVDGANPNFVDYKRNAEKFDGDYYRPYMGLPTATLWFSTNTYTIGTVVRHSSSTYYWGDSINFRYVNKSGCSGANPEPGIPGLSSWSNCWEFATYQTIKDAIANGLTFTDATIGAASADVNETLVRWVQYGYRPQGVAFSTAAHDGGTIGAMPAITGIGGAPVVSPSTATVFVKNSVQFTSSGSVTWSLVPGSIGSIDSNGLYTAPDSIQNLNVIDGCAIPDDHIYNVSIDSLPVDANSATRVAAVGAVNMVFELSFPRNAMTNSNTVASTMTFVYTTTQNGSTYYLLPAPYRGVETNLYPDDYFAQDRHTLGVNSDTCEYQEIYNPYPRGTNVAECLNCNAQSGVKYGPMSYQLAAYDGSTDAAGLYIQPLMLRYDELKRGQVNHALRFTLSNGRNYAGFVWPGTNFSNQCGTFTTCFPYGSRLRLKASFNETGFSPTAKVILRTMKTKGIILADGGISGHLQTATDVVSDSVTFQALMTEIPNSSLDFTDFEQVDESSLMISSATGRVRVPNSYNVVPNNYAIVVAVNNVDGSSTTVWVAVQGVAAGTKNLPFPPNSGTLSVMAGTPQFQIPYWVKGATTTTATCTMSPTIGTLTSGCLYTPPATQVGISSAIVTITPTADSTGTITFPLTVFPSDGIRVDVGGKAGSISSPAIPYDAAGNYGPDANGKYWWADPVGNIVPWYSLDDMSSPQASWPGTTDVGLWYTARHGTSDGAFAAAMVPNGTYLLSVYFARDANTNTVVQSLESQNQVLMSSAAWITFRGSSNYNTLKATFSVTVVDNTFYAAVRFPDPTKFSMINAWSLESNASPGVPLRFYMRGGRSFRFRGGRSFVFR